jgi:hypothetical protein
MYKTMLKFLMSMLVLCSIATVSATVDLEIRHEKELLGECLDCDDYFYDNFANLDFVKKYQFYNYSLPVDEIDASTNITGYTQAEYCGIAVQLCFNLRGKWSNYKTCNVY